MSGIQSSVGLITGLPIDETVNKLMAISAQPRDTLATRNAGFKQEQVAVNDLMVGVIAIRLASERLANPNTYATRNIASSDSDVLAATITGKPVAGTYTFTPLETASSHHILSGGIASDTAALGTSTYSFHQGADGETFSVSVDADDTIRDLASKINALGTNVAASVINDGSGTPYRLSLVSTKSGEDYEIVSETNTTGLAFSEIAAARDARLAIGDADSDIVVTSAKNEFLDVLEGVRLVIKDDSTDPITVTVTESDAGLVTNAKLLVDQYNKLADKIDTYTKFDATANTKGVLFGSTAVLNVQNQLSALVTGRLSGAGDIGSLAELGFSIDDQGKLALDDAKLRETYEENPQGVVDFFSTETTGFGAKMTEVSDRLAGESGSVLLARSQALQRKIEFAGERINFFNDRLSRERERLLKTFYDLESAVAKYKSVTSSITSLQALANPVSS